MMMMMSVVWCGEESINKVYKLLVLRKLFFGSYCCSSAVAIDASKWIAEQVIAICPVAAATELANYDDVDDY